jgi:phosphate starvation-inducible PhoH-like protein
LKRAEKTVVERVKKEKFVRDDFATLTPRNEKQKILLEELRRSTLVAATGSAGTGKTIMACWHAARKLHYGDVKKVILIRAYQPLAGRSIGFLPGTLDEKLMPYYQQMIDYFEDYLGKATTEIHLKQKTIEICSLETIRGRSWERAIIIVDEAQSLFVPEVQALVTRIGEGSQMIFCGDNSGTQTDVRVGTDGLTYLEQLVLRYEITDTAFVKFTRDDIVRSGITKEFVVAFEEELGRQDPLVALVDIDKQFKKGR